VSLKLNIGCSIEPAWAKNDNGIAGCYLRELPLQLGSSGAGNNATAGFPLNSNGFKAAQAFSTILFAYQGQTIFPEVIYEMSEPVTFICTALHVFLAFPKLVAPFNS
jgi:hypothetical protein